MNVITSPLLNRVAGVRHAFFSRHGGVSSGVYDSLNVGRGSRDAPRDVAENRRRCAEHFGEPVDRLLTCYQIHSTTVLTAHGSWGEDRPEADGVVAMAVVAPLASVSAPLTCSVLPFGAMVPPDATVTAPTVPEPPNVPPDATVTALDAMEPVTCKMPAFTVVAPE